MTRSACARTGTVRHQPVAFMPSPMTRSTGAPAPVLSQWMSTDPLFASGIAACLLEDAAGGRCVRVRELAREVGLRVGDRLEPVDLALLTDPLGVVGDRLQRTLVDVEVRVAGLAARLQDPLVQVADAVRGGLGVAVRALLVSIGGAAAPGALARAAATAAAAAAPLAILSGRHCWLLPVDFSAAC